MITPTRVVLLFAALACSSIAALPFLRISPFPSVSGHTLLIRFSSGSDNPALVEAHITSPLENVLSTSPGVRRITSVSRAGQGVIRLEFDHRKDMAARIPELRALIRQVYPKLHSLLAFPLIESEETETEATLPVLVCTVDGPATANQMAAHAGTAFRQGLRGMAGIARIYVPEPIPDAIFFRYAPEKLYELGIVSSDLSNALQPYRLPLIKGKVGNDIQQSLWKLEWPLRDSAISDVPITLPGGRIIALGQIGQLAPGDYPSTSAPLRINGNQAVSISCYAHPDANKLELSNAIQHRLPDIRRMLPAGYTLRIARDGADYLRAEISKSRTRTLRTLGIVCLFLLSAYRSRSHFLLLLVMLAINAGITLLLLVLLRIEIHLFTISGISIASGLMIDNTLVMLDYLSRGQLRAARAPMAGATLSTVLSLAYVWWLPDQTRYQLADFSAAIGLGLLASLAVSWFLLPALAALLGIRPQPAARLYTPSARRKVRLFRCYSRCITRTAGWKKTVLFGWLLAFGIPIYPILSKWPNDNQWKPSLERWTQGSIGLFLKQIGVQSGARKPIPNHLYVELQLPWGFPPTDIDTLIRPIESLMGAAELIETYSTQVSPPGFARIVASFDQRSNPREAALQLRSEIAAYAYSFSGVQWNIYGTGPAFSLGESQSLPAYRLKLSGYRLSELEAQVQRLDRLLRLNPRVLHLNPNAGTEQDESAVPGFRLLLRSDKYPNESAPEAYSALGGRQPAIGPVLSNDPTPYWLVLTPLPPDPLAIQRIRQQPIFISREVAIGSAAIEIQQTEQAASIHREERQFIRVFSFTYGGSSYLGERLIAETLSEMRQQLPAGYQIERYEDQFDRADTQRGTITMLIVLLLSVFFFGSIVFNRVQTGIWLSIAVSASLIGLFLVFGLGYAYYDQGGIGAIILVSGLSINAFLYVLADFKQQAARKKNPNRTLLKAIFFRSPTVLLTTFSSIGGLLPLFMDGAEAPFWYALAAGTSGGLLCSLLVYYWLLPVWHWQRT